jgi:hypothetical protein
MQLVTPAAATSVDRVALDFYETPPPVTEELLTILGPHLAPGMLIDEPCVGDGAIAQVLIGHGCQVRTFDIDHARLADYHGDSGDPQFLESIGGPRPDWNVSNPPFSEIHRVVPATVPRAKIASAFLLRISHIEPVANRREWWLAHPPQHRLTTERISFRTSGKGSKTDSVTTEWCIWTADGEPLDGVPVHGWCMWKSHYQPSEIAA